MNYRKISIDLAVGQRILIGNHTAKITKIEQQHSGDITINTTRGPRKVLTFRLLADSDDRCADAYR